MRGGSIPSRVAKIMRICKNCEIEDEVENFPSAGKVNGTQYYRHICKPCHNKQKRTRRSGIREQVIEYKKTLICVGCGFDDYRALQFHHTDDNKEFNIGDGVGRGYALERIKEEINKCIVLCANCHSIEHYKNNSD